MTPAQETRKMIREFVYTLDAVRQLALCLDAHLDTPDKLHGLDRESVEIVLRAAQHMINEAESNEQIDLRCWLEETETETES